ncbi:MAG: hypothetical protein N3A01_09180 [Bacteroidales bacterium]|nr:hypothetical protein [Bacteroidales bacterium]
MKYFFCIVFFLLLGSCNHYKINESDNVLIEKNIFCAYIISEKDLRNEIFNNNFLLSTFFTFLLQKLKDIIIYNSCFSDTVFRAIGKNEKNNIIDKFIKEKNFYNAIYFFEKWHLDTLNGINFKKEPLYWSPVYFNDSARLLKIPFKIKNTEKISKNVVKVKTKYEINIDDTILLMNSNINVSTLKRILSEIALSIKFKVYDPFSLKVLDKNTIRKKLEIVNGSDFSNVSISSLLFEEWWFIDTVTFSINKKIISLAPVLYEYNEDNELNKKILFVLFLEGKPHKII